MNAAEAFSLAVDTASEDDRIWFEAHPDRSYRIRVMVPLEYPGAPSPGWMAVHQLRPGWRVRMYVGTGYPPPDSEDAARHWFDHAITRLGAGEALEGIRQNCWAH